MPNVFDWKRFWCPRGGNINLGDGGFLSDPDERSGKIFNPELVAFDQLAEIPCLALLGEPGIGKSWAIQGNSTAAREAAASQGDKVIHLDLRSYGSEDRLVQNLFEAADWKMWRSGSHRLHVFLDSLDECLLQIKNVAALLADELLKQQPLVSVGQYPPNLHRSPVPTAVPSAKKIEELFQQGAIDGPVHVWGTGDSCGHALADSGATKAEILRCLDQVIQQAKPEDMVVLFFDGHGGPTGDNELFYYIPVDYSDSPEGGPSTAISSAELATALRSLQAHRLVIIMDTCDAGAAVEPMAAVIEARIKSVVSTAPQGQMSNSVSKLAMQGALLVAASTGIEDKDASKSDNPFMDYLVQVLQCKQAVDGVCWSHTVASQMKGLGGVTVAGASIHPVAIAIGADFAVTKK